VHVARIVGVPVAADALGDARDRVGHVVIGERDLVDRGEPRGHMQRRKPGRERADEILNNRGRRLAGVFLDHLPAIQQPGVVDAVHIPRDIGRLLFVALGDGENDPAEDLVFGVGVGAVDFDVLSLDRREAIAAQLDGVRFVIQFVGDLGADDPDVGVMGDAVDDDPDPRLTAPEPERAQASLPDAREAEDRH
jgi:hypothetical protein